MFGMQTLDVAVGLIFVYLLLAFICTGINELIAGCMDKRTKNLIRGIRNLLYEETVTLKDPKDNKDKDLATLFLSHPLIKSLKEDGTPPSYIPPRIFSLTLLDILAPADADRPRSISEIRDGVKRLPAGSDLGRSLVLMMDQGGEDVKNVHRLIEAWFNDAMDRISAWYKQKTQILTIVVAIVVTLIAGADTIQITRSLLNDPAVRSTIVAEARVAATEMQPPSAERGEAAKAGKLPGTAGNALGKADLRALRENIEELKGLGLQLGWTDLPWREKPKDGWPRKIIGLLITALAASLGAPFWFDLLNRFMSIRAVGKSPAEKEKADKLESSRPGKSGRSRIGGKSP